KWADYAGTRSFPARQIFRREARQLLRFDRYLSAKTDASIFVSKSEAELFRKRVPELAEKILTIPNGVDTSYFSPEKVGPNPGMSGAPIIVFTGQMDYWPNIDGVVWFADNVLPVLRERRPGASFYVVGAHPSAAIRALNLRPGIVVTGQVP